MSVFIWKPGDQLPAHTSIDWLWEGYIAAGTVAIVGGPAGVGKSTLVAALEVAVAGGAPFLEAGVRQGEAWHIDFDSSEKLQGPWYAKVAAGLGLPQKVLKAVRYVEPSDPAKGLDLAGLDELAKAVEAHKPALIVIDSWSSAFFYADSKKAEHVAEIMLHLRQLAALGPGVVLLDHSPKPAVGLGPLERGIAGSFYKLGGARSAFLVQRVAPKLTSGVDMLRWDCLKNNLAPLSESVGIARHFERDSLRFELAELPAEEGERAPATSRAERAIREILSEGPTLRADLIRQVAERANASERTIAAALARLKASGELVVQESGGRGSPALYMLHFALNQEKPDNHRADLVQRPLQQMGGFALNGQDDDEAGEWILEI